MIAEYSYPTVVKIEDIYNAPLSEIRIPSGFEIIDFRPPKLGEWFWTNTFYEVVAEADFKFFAPRLILKKTNEVIDDRKPVVITVGDIYEKDVVIPEGWKFKRFGLPVAGDYYLNKTDPRMREYWDKFMGSHDSPRIIVTKA